MKNLIFFLITFFLVSCTTETPKKILVVTGGHSYDTTAFVEMFRSMEGIEFDTVIQPRANRVITSDTIDHYDALVFYDMWQDITGPEKQAYLNLLEKGMGMVFLHHSLVSYQEWPEFREIIGGRYINDIIPEDSLRMSGFKHDIDLEYRIVDPLHPVTSGMRVFNLHDEGYIDFEVGEGMAPLLTTQHPDSDSLVGWTHEYRNFSIVYLQPGHDKQAFEYPNYRKLVKQAIEYVAGNQGLLAPL